VTVVVTGAAGFIGSHLTERLLANGESVVGIDSFTDYYDPDHKRRNLVTALDHARFTLVEGNLTELDLVQVLDGVDATFHLAGQPGVRVSWGSNFDVYVRDNVLATQVLLEGCKAAGIGRVVVASSSSVYGQAESFPTSEAAEPRPVSPYGVSKLAAEHLCRLYAANFGLRCTLLRYFSVYGPRQRPDMAFSRFIDAAIRGESVSVYGDGRQTRDFTFVSDIVEATVAAADRDVDGTFNVAGGSQVSVLDAIVAIAENLGKEIDVRHEAAVAGDPRQTSGDTSLAAQLLGYEPATTFAEGITAQVAERLAARA
jgi:UDP-glucuronate 4-epimerase